MIDEFEADDRARQVARFRPVERAPKQHVFAVMTCAGREDLLDETLTSLGRTPDLVVCDGDPASVPDTVGYLYAPYFVRRGQAQTFFELLRHAIQLYPGLAFLTMFEDDVIACRRVIEYIATTKFDDDIAMYSWFHRLAPNPLQAKPTWMIGPARDFSHQQAITLPAKTVRALLVSPQLQAWSEPHGADMLLGQVMPDAKVAYHFPNIVNHVAGNASLTGNAGARTSCTFVGEDFDAFDLTR